MAPPANTTKELSSRWHGPRREQRRIEEGFVLAFLDVATPSDAITLFDAVPTDAQDALLDHLSTTHGDYWSKLGIVGVIPYDPDAESEDARQARFLATIAVILNAKQAKSG